MTTHFCPAAFVFSIPGEVIFRGWKLKFNNIIIYAVFEIVQGADIAVCGSNCAVQCIQIGINIADVT